MQIHEFIDMIDREIEERKRLILELQRDIDMFDKVKQKCNGEAPLPLTSLLDTLQEASMEAHGRNIFAKLIGDKDETG